MTSEITTLSEILNFTKIKNYRHNGFDQTLVIQNENLAKGWQISE
jgi:hypothetical protein